MERREITEVLPYYFEWLIHLDILSRSWIIVLTKEWENYKVSTNINLDTYKKLIEIYKQEYNKLIKVYLNQKDAGEFLFDFVEMENAIWLPKDTKLKDFVQNYYWLYKKYGNEVVKG
jgi:hypothetical protein